MNLARLLICFLFSISIFPASAHQVASVELEFLKLENAWRLDGEMDIAYMLPETRNVLGGLPLKRSEVMQSPPEEFSRIRKETENTLRKLLRFTFAGQEIPWRVEFPDFQKDPFELPPEDGDIALVSTQILIDPIVAAGELRIHWAGEQETELIILIEENTDSPQVISTLPGGNLMILNQVAAPQTSAPGQPLDQAPPIITAPNEKPFLGGWLQSGFSHVLPKGLDHLLFILGLFLLLPKWKPLLGQSLLFTLAHSITLALSIFGIVDLPSQLVEVLIAVSIAWIGIENLFVKKLGKQRLILVFGFGLLHGLGFAGVLAEKLSGIPREKLVGPLLGFNIGVELAQITVLLCAFLILWPLKKWTKQIQQIGSSCIALAGFAWVIERLM
ncbi:MAG: HupE/UreJ family protein [Akkermansiaceae bacterium]|nr:HupE/UreJ family protein [Akkermansiaceae bacterium]